MSHYFVDIDVKCATPILMSLSWIFFILNNSIVLKSWEPWLVIKFKSFIEFVVHPAFFHSYFLLLSHLGPERTHWSWAGTGLQQWLPGSWNPGTEPASTGRRVHDGAPHRMGTGRSPPGDSSAESREPPRTFIHRSHVSSHAPSASQLTATIDACALLQAFHRTAPDYPPPHAPRS